MRISIGSILMIVIAVLSLSDAALAWGPVTHVGLANSILDQISLLPVAIGTILSKNRLAYLYGNIAADVVFAKRLSRVKQFCHHWSTAFRLWHHAEYDRDKAFAYGYLSHLAADTVAHGKYVPRQILVNNMPINYGHFYWELRADAIQNTKTWSTLEELLAHNHEDHHETLSDHIVDTFLPYDLNRLLFDRMNAFAVRPGFQRSLNVWNRLTRRELSADLLHGYWNESIDRIQSVLVQGDQSSLLREDPNGTSALMQIRVRRAEVRRMKFGGRSITHRISEISRGLAPAQWAHSNINTSKT